MIKNKKSPPRKKKNRVTRQRVKMARVRVRSSAGSWAWAASSSQHVQRWGQRPGESSEGEGGFPWEPLGGGEGQFWLSRVRGKLCYPAGDKNSAKLRRPMVTPLFFDNRLIPHLFLMDNRPIPGILRIENSSQTGWQRHRSSLEVPKGRRAGKGCSGGHFGGGRRARRLEDEQGSGCPGEGGKLCNPGRPENE